MLGSDPVRRLLLFAQRPLPGHIITDMRVFILLFVCFWTTTAAQLLQALKLLYFLYPAKVCDQRCIFWRVHMGKKKPSKYCSLHWHNSSYQKDRPWLLSWLAACHCEVLPSVKAWIPPVQTGAPTQVASCVKMFGPEHILPLSTLFFAPVFAVLFLSMSHFTLETKPDIKITQFIPAPLCRFSCLRIWWRMRAASSSTASIWK